MHVHSSDWTSIGIAVLSPFWMTNLEKDLRQMMCCLVWTSISLLQPCLLILDEEHRTSPWIAKVLEANWRNMWCACCAFIFWNILANDRPCSNGKPKSIMHLLTLMKLHHGTVSRVVIPLNWIATSPLSLEKASRNWRWVRLFMLMSS
jgi:hypothetical protein